MSNRKMTKEELEEYNVIHGFAEKAIREPEFMCATCGKDFPSLDAGEKHGKETGHSIHG